LEYQGVKFIDRFDPVTYVKLTEQMDSHDVSRNRVGSVAHVLSRVEIPACVLGIDSDVLYPLSEQQELTEMLPCAKKLHIIHSEDGHDGFLLEQEQVASVIIHFLDDIGDSPPSKEEPPEPSSPEMMSRVAENCTLEEQRLSVNASFTSRTRPGPEVSPD
jgi:homoserine O-acetyltransferase